MNKKFKTLLTAGLVTVIAGSSIVSSSALCKKTIDTYKTKGAVYLNINGKKYKIPLVVNNKPSQKEDTSTENNNNQGNNNANTGNNSNQNNNNTNAGNNSNQNNNNTNAGNSSNQGNNNANTGNNNNNTNDKNDNVVEKPNTDNNTSNNNESTTGSFSSFQKEVTRLVNVERSKRGLSELAFNSQLSNVATLKSQDMINKNYFSHTSPTYGSPFDMMKQFNISYKAAGENIAMGQKTPAEVVNAWMNSQGHRENILNPNFTDIGVGVAKSSNGTLYWTQMFIGK
ncbi:sporulation protein [Terrisporobacter petrolearius]|uniref:CAP domain-containing protein n=1 Tax=Terrisporobacter petrolearius TaxID=1460447 RepID=UPI001D16D28E|nr:CAP domain-containing protein [Terrisporobacter petrolearius]MCC3865734.1 sporulation protein [Terrisporobacter petrolearius]